MRRALELAAQGVYSTKPNPAVGCVISKDNQIIAEGWHHKAGGPHAERVALADAKAKGVSVEGATAYVTLEPCSHFGRTPPCADGLVEAGIARCVVAMLDPNPQVAGRGMTRLQQAGIEIQSGLFESEAEALNRAFLFAMRQQRPYVFLKMASSLDGRTAMANGESQWITGAQSRQSVHQLRARVGAIITGIGTVLADDPSLNVRLSHEQLMAMQLDEQDCYPVRVLLDSALQVSADAKLLNQPGKTIIYCSSQAYQAQSKNMQGLPENVTVSVVEYDADGLSLKAVLQDLWLTHGINSVLVEAGATLAGAFVRSGLVNELHAYMAPVLMGSSARSMFELPELAAMSDKIEFSIDSMQQFGEDIRLILQPKRSVIHAHTREK